MNLILASGSPRRRELLNQMGLTFTVKPVDADESLTPGLSPREQVKLLSLKKAQAAADAFGAEPVILTADTVVVLGDTILGKPRDAEDAKKMLLALSGTHHLVLTGVTCGDLFYQDILLHGAEAALAQILEATKELDMTQ